MFTSQGQAKRFFVDKIAAQAVTEGTPLSDAERQMLSFSESDPEFAVDPALVAGLIERSWKRDIETDGNAGNLYREAFTTLSRGDHYLLIMIERALRRHLRPWWAFWR